VCRRACLLQPLVVRRFAPNSKGMAIRSVLSRARSVLDNAHAQRRGQNHHRLNRTTEHWYTRSVAVPSGPALHPNQSVPISCGLI
jgi:hypothetical protein